MNILVLIEHQGGRMKASSLDNIQYAHQLKTQQSAMNSAKVYGVVFAAEAIAEKDLQSIGGNGVEQLLHFPADVSQASAYAHNLLALLKEHNIKLLLLGKSLLSEQIGASLAVAWDAAFVTEVNALPESMHPFILSRNIYTGKATEKVEVSSERLILSVLKSTVFHVNESAMPTVTQVQEIPYTPTLKITETHANTTHSVSLPEAEKVVSAGRGVKGPENWGMIEELAHLLGAATACSKPVSDMEWRPHHEHVGQTGLKIRPNLYIAIGISGAIQHVAGVSNSKVIVVINKDAEAPFFNTADYGMVGDAFEIVPKLIASLQA